MSEMIAFTTLVDIDPRPSNMSRIRPDDEVSFIAMADVSETGEWVRKQTRRVSELGAGYTPFEEGDVLFAKITPCMENGKGVFASGLAGGVGFGSTEFFVLRPKPGAAPRFIFHWSQNPKFRKLAESFMIGSAGQQRVQPGFFTRTQVPRLPLEQQQCVAAVLDIVEQTLRSTERLVAKLKLMKQGLLHDLLTRGIDDNGELRDPDRHPEQFKDSPLGRIPQEWKTVTLEQVVDPLRPVAYGILMPGQGVPGGVPVVKVKDIYGGQINTADLLLTSPTIDYEYRRSRLCEGDLLFTIRGTVGRTAFVPPELAGANITQDTARLAIKGACPPFVQSYLDMPKPRRFVENHTIGVAVRGINLRDVRKIPVAHPPLREAAAIATRISTTDEVIRQERVRTSKLRLLKQALMDDLLTGRIRVTPLLEGSMQAL